MNNCPFSREKLGHDPIMITYIEICLLLDGNYCASYSGVIPHPYYLCFYTNFTVFRIFGLKDIKRKLL
jgi:hypothetical protein